MPKSNAARRRQILDRSPGPPVKRRPLKEYVGGIVHDDEPEAYTYWDAWREERADLTRRLAEAHGRQVEALIERRRAAGRPLPRPVNVIGPPDGGPVDPAIHGPCVALLAARYAAEWADVLGDDDPEAA